ncbi:3-deoxy-D-manno-octulosonic acid transferase [Roseateles sp. BYS180W]|uniref:3-deoxy-D-manno-octulosonic acid transferase n=1 Tax=Roseateles rivi TaxID=3299028 RepID=A0ABW7FVE0_9BURK
MPLSGRERLALWVYSALLRLLTPLYFLRLLARSRAEPLYRAHWLERLGCGAATAPGAVWVHAVSLGETRAAEPLLAALRAAHPGLRLLLTHSTATGRAAGQPLLREGDAQRWLPLDTPGAVARFLKRHRPLLGVLMETEIWPNLQRAATQAGVPMVLANARLSERSLRRGQRLHALLAPAARSLHAALAQSAADAQRLRQAGVAEVQVCGNLKFDMRPNAALLAQGQRWRAQLDRPVLLLAVSREGEEAALLQVWRQHFAQQGQGRAPLLLLVPRHPQRFDEVAALVQASSWTLQRRSHWADELPLQISQVDVCLGDSLREMPLYYGLADVALLGGSFEPLGGQNLIEAAACACPLLMGPHTFNFAQAAELALQAGAARRCADVPSAVQQALQLLEQPAALQSMREAALQFAAAHQGAAQRSVQLLQPLLKKA